MAAAAVQAAATGKGAEISYGNIALLSKGRAPVGQLRVSSDAGMAWRNTESGKSHSIDKKDIARVSWIRVGRSAFVLKLTLASGGHPLMFEGFRADDETFFKEALASWGPNGKLELEYETPTTTGWNWGQCTIDGGFDPVEDDDDDSLTGANTALHFKVKSQTAFDIPLSEVSNATLQTAPLTRNDVTLHFHQDDTLSTGVSLVELRVMIPNKHDGAEGIPSSAKNFHERVLSLADVAGSTDKPLAVLPEQQLMAPRGRYEIQLFPKYMKVHGKSYTFTVRYDNISRLYQLPQPDQAHVLFVISLEQALRKDRQQHSHLVFRFERGNQLNVEFTLDKDAAKKFPAFAQDLQGEAYKVFATIMSNVAGQKIVTAGSYTAAGPGRRAGGDQDVSVAVKCSLGSNEGYLYPLQKSFFFLLKPALLIRHNQIAEVEFARYNDQSGMDSRTFDLRVETNDGKTHVFSAIARAEYQNLFDFIRDRKLRISNLADLQAGAAARHTVTLESDSDGDVVPVAPAAGQTILDMFGGEDESDDDSFASVESSDVSDEFSEGSAESDDLAPKKKKSSKKSKSSSGSKKRKAKKEKRSKKSKKRARTEDAEDGAGEGAGEELD